MLRNCLTSVVSLALALSAAPLPAASPAPVSPEGQVAGRCPTFSWSEPAEAEEYELVAYDVDSEGEVTDTPILMERLPAGARSWTPSVERCLEAGGSYAWSVRSVGEGGTSAWSEPALFEVAGAPSIDEVERALDTLRRYMREDRGAAAADAPEAAATEPAPEASSGPAGRPALRSTTSAGPRLATAAAPTLGTASLSVSDQIHLDADSEVFKRGDVFLWDDSRSRNLALGESALTSATSSAQDNTAVGYRALEATTATYANEGDRNTAVGARALRANTTGINNTAVGAFALHEATIGEWNTAVGTFALSLNEDGQNNSALGVRALSDNVDGFGNTAVGASALKRNETGSGNTASGSKALLNNTSGDTNVAIGLSTLILNTTGSSNVAIGVNAGEDAPVDASNNIFIGHGGDASDSDANGPTIRIGENQNRTFIDGIHSAALGGGNAHTVCVDDADQLGQCPASSARFKQQIRPLEVDTDRLSDLEPIEFRYRPGRWGGPEDRQIGLLAEDVAELFPELVVRDRDGEPFGVRYDLLSVMLLHEVQELRRELEAIEGGEPAEEVAARACSR